MRKKFLFKESLPHLPEKVDERRPIRQVISMNEAGARGRLPKPGPGRIWRLIEVIGPKAPEPIPRRDNFIVPVMLDGDHEATIGFAEVRSDGIIDLTLNQIRVQETNLPFPRGTTHVSVQITYQGVCTHNRKDQSL